MKVGNCMRRKSSIHPPPVSIASAEKPYSMQICRDVPRWTVFLHAGQIIASSKPDQVLTILGSCVSVCLWDPEIRAGGVNHFLLPRGPDTKSTSPRFAAGAIATLIEELGSLGCRRDNLRAKVFGGASVLPSNRDADCGVGATNMSEAFEILETERIPVVSRDVGGNRGRKLIFSVVDGHAWVKRI